MGKHRKKAAVIAGFAIIIGLTLVFLGNRRSPDNAASLLPAHRARPPVSVEIAPVERGTMAERRAFTGSLRPASEFNVANQVAGRIVALPVDLGDPVERGQVVARLDDDKYRFELQQVRAELEVARANLAEAESTLETRRREFERVTRLREQRVASESELDSIRAEYRAQQARVRVAAAQVTQRTAALMGAELMLSYTVIRADWQDDDLHRFVGERFVDEGAYLTANTPIFSIVRIDRLRAVAYATEGDYPRLSPGRKAAISADAVPGKIFCGHVSRLAPVARETSRQARMEIDVDNSELALKPGMFVRIEIELDRSENTIIVPREAVIEQPEGRGVFIADRENAVARYVEVETGLQTRDHVEVLNPPLEGYVITLGRHLLSDGSPILLPEESPVPSGGGHR
jgi:RND family efflux transporter MFP subunit